MNTNPFALAALLLVLAACGSPQTAPTPQAGGRVVGLLEVSFDLGGAAQARLLPAGTVGVSAQANTVVSDAGLNFSRRFVSFYDDDTAPATRYVQSVFNITNTTARPFANLTLYAINVPGTTIGGTTVASIFDATGAAVTSASVVQGMLPTHGMRVTATGLEVDPGRADLHVINQAEAATVETGAAALTPPIVGSVLQYGFVARNLAGGRAIGAAGCAGVGCNRGTVTLAFKFPRVTPRSANPWAFQLYFAVADESETFVTQSVEEQASNSALLARLAALGVGSSQARLLGGSTFAAGTNLCQVRTAGTSATPLANLLPADVVEVDRSCGDNPAFLAAVNAARATARTCGSTNFPAAPPLAWNQKLARATINNALDMATIDSYNTPTSLGTQISNTGYQGLLVNWVWPDSGGSPAATVSSWLGIPYLCAVTMNPSYTNMGMAVRVSSSNTARWSVVLGDGE